MSIPYKDIYNSVADKKDINSHDQNSNEEIIKLAIKYYHEFKKKRNMSSVEIMIVFANMNLFKRKHKTNTIGEITMIESNLHTN